MRIDGKDYLVPESRFLPPQPWEEVWPEEEEGWELGLEEDYSDDYRDDMA